MNYRNLTWKFFGFVVSFLWFIGGCKLGNNPAGPEEGPVILLPTPVITRVVDFYEGLNIQWDTVEGASSYILYWTEDGSEPNLESSQITGLTRHFYIHTGLHFSKLYKYRLQAVDGNKVSALSGTASGRPMIPKLDPPENVSASETSGGDIQVTWDAVDFEGVVYGVKRRIPASETSFKVIAENLEATGFVDETIEEGKGYYYRVFAVDAVNERTSADSDAAYAATMKIIYEKEQNNATSHPFRHWLFAEDSTEGLDWFRIRGDYSGQYRFYSAAFYKYYEIDCFLLTLNSGDMVTFTLLKGQYAGTGGMTADVLEWTNNDNKVMSHAFVRSGDSFTYRRTSSMGTVLGTYLKITMPDDLINHGPYSYEVEIRIHR